MRSINSQFYRLIFVALFLLLTASLAFGDPKGTPPTDESKFGFYLLCVLMIAGIGVGSYFWKKNKDYRAEVSKPLYNYQMSYSNRDVHSYNMDAIGANRDLELLRNGKHKTNKQSSVSDRKRPALAESGPDTRAFQEKMRKLQYTQLPINSFSQLAAAKSYKPLDISNDPSLLGAIEQANEEYEEDESVRDLALRILTAFRNRNSVETIAQMALYDLSSNLRSKAVTVLADFDHESVFETILLACADPTREVRAAAARGLFRLSFDRAHAWKRILEANDEFRMRHAARAAVESGIVAKSFDRLVHEDLKIAYEAFALVSLLIKAGETETIFDTISDHKDERVKYALLHVLKVNKEERTLAKLNDLRMSRSWPTELSDRIRDTVASFEQVAAWSGREL